jgi:hypothetical protein
MYEPNSLAGKPAAPLPGLATRSVPTFAVDMEGQPIIGGKDALATAVEQRGGRDGFLAYPEYQVASATPANGPAFGGGWGSDGFVLPGMNREMLVAQAPAPRQRPAFGPTVHDPFQTILEDKDQTRLPTNAGEREFMAAFYPNAANPAVAATEQMAGGGVPMPRPRPGFVQPFTPSARLRAAPQQQPGPSPATGSITFRRGDTVENLARGRGMTTNEFAAHYGIADPNRIFAGQTVNPGGGRAPAPQQRTAPSPHQQTPAPGPTAINSKGKTVTQQTGTFYNPDTNKFEQRTVYR